MSKLTPFLLAVAALLLLAACSEEKQPKSPLDAFQVTPIFEVEGCKVYRFYDNSYFRYFANCPGASVSSHQGSKAKQPHTISTF